MTSRFVSYSSFAAALIFATVGGTAVAALDPTLATYFDQHCNKCHDAQAQA
jgi:hypothetical protein